MQYIKYLIDFVLHIDVHLSQILAAVGGWTYGVLFVIVFIETGLVVTPFLPGDSLLFAAGAFAAKGDLNLPLLYVLMALAAIAGDTANYWIGHFIGPRAFSGNIRFLKKEYMDRTVAFYHKHGGKTIFLARFVPIIRTFAPFVAGVGQMHYGYFITYNLVGGLVWTALFLSAGYFFGNISFVKNNFSTVIIAIILISLIPVGYEAWKARKAPKNEDKGPIVPANFD